MNAETVVIRVCAQLQDFYVLGSYRNPDSDDTIFDCLLMAMSLIQDDDRKAAFVFIGDFNAHHREWLESVSPTDSHGRAALDFDNVSCYSLQLRGQEQSTVHVFLPFNYRLSFFPKTSCHFHCSKSGLSVKE